MADGLPYPSAAAALNELLQQTDVYFWLFVYKKRDFARGYFSPTPRELCIYPE